MSVAEDFGRQFGLVEPQRITQGITKRELAKVLKDAADDAARVVIELSGTEGFGAVIQGTRLNAVRMSLQQISMDMWNETGRITEAGMYEEAQLAAEQALKLDRALGMPRSVMLQYQRALSFQAQQSVESLISRHTNGYSLSERIYANGKVTTKQVGKIIDRALAQQSSWRELAREVKAFYHPNVPGGASYAAKRLARTEINNAHHETTIRLAQPKPWVLGFKWNLSSSHPKPDPCDDLANRNGGVYKKADAPRRPHPQCLCYLTHVQEDDEVFVEKLATGKYDDYLRTMGVSVADS